MSFGGARSRFQNLCYGLYLSLDEEVRFIMLNDLETREDALEDSHKQNIF